MTGHHEFALRGLSLSTATWYFSVALGWPLIGYAIFELMTTPGAEYAPAFAMIAMLAVLLELMPLVQGRGHDPQGVVMSTAFSAAMLFLWGVGPAVVMVALGSVAADMRARKQWWKTVFNPAQYALSFGAAYLLMRVGHEHVSLDHPLAKFTAGDLWWMVFAWVAYFVVNLALVSAVLAWSERFRDLVRDDLWHNTAMTFAVLGLSPLIVTLAQGLWQLIPLLLIPLLLIYHTAQLSLEREHAASHDALTGLPNRATLQYRLQQALQAYERDGTGFGLLLLDLDDFKAVNDTLGHPVGDGLLTKVAQRLRANLRPGDLVARLGGDEFAVIVGDATTPDVLGVAERIRGGLADAIELENLSVEVQLSIGVASCPEHATDAAALLSRADVAMYRAKATRTGVEVYSTDHDHNTATRLGLIAELRQALEADELELFYQPKLDKNRATMGVEALVRWRHPQRGYVAPDQFIPLAERSGVMPMLTARVVSLALDQIARWRDQGMDIPVAVNVSPTDLAGDELTEHLAQALDHYQVPASMLQFEITERIATHHLEESRRTLNRLRDMGVAISLDDFGTGYSSLLRLHTMPVDEIKIDRVFVAQLEEDSRSYGIVGTLVGLAHALGVPAIAEGVETEEQLQLLERLGCDGVQGWHIARPMPCDVATRWLRGRRRAPLPDASAPVALRAAEVPVPAGSGVEIVA